VRFEEDSEPPVYYGTYTAFSGTAIASELLVTRDFQRFEMHPLSGLAAGGKGMALFPRRIDGAYTMIGRQNDENLYLLRSDNLFHWEDGTHLASPVYPWELVQIGNCGAAIETDQGLVGIDARRRGDAKICRSVQCFSTKAIRPECSGALGCRLQNGLRRLGDHPGCFKKCSLSSTGKKAHTAIRYPVRDPSPVGAGAPDLWTRKVFDPTALCAQPIVETVQKTGLRRLRARVREKPAFTLFQRRLVCSRAPFDRSVRCS
jgi:hypothetical protein